MLVNRKMVVSAMTQHNSVSHFKITEKTAWFYYSLNNTLRLVDTQICAIHLGYVLERTLINSLCYSSGKDSGKFDFEVLNDFS